MTTETVKNFRLYDTEQFIVTRVAHDIFEGNESQAIRHMIRDYGKRHLVDPVPEDEAVDARAMIGGNGK